jgi:hypothetical protein
MAAAHAGVWVSTASTAASKPSVWAAMKSWSTRSRATTWWSMPDSSAESVPGRNPRKRSAVRAMGVTRGSATINRAPRSRARQM